MRARLFIVFLVPLTAVLVALGGAYAWSVSRSIQQEFTNQQLGDLNYFATSVRQALRAGNPGLVEAEMVRYADLYGSRIAAIDRAGAVWASSSARAEVLEEATRAQISLALSGRRGEPLPASFPWASGDAVMVEPVFDDGNVIGAVMISASVDEPRDEIISHWVLLVVALLLVIGLLLIIIDRLAVWVLRPMRRVDRAMVAIEQGEIGARIDDDTGPPETRTMIRLFNQMADEIERSLSRQQEFAMNASHELRNPLGALLMRVEYLATGLDESWSDEVEKTREEGRRMTRILDTLLSMARAGKQDSPFAVVDLAELVDGRVAAWRPVSREKRVTFRVEGESPLLSLTDRTAVESALDAIIDNAVRFAPPGSVIEVSAERAVGTGADSAGCLISVRDHGPGVAPDELEHLTRRFWRSPRDLGLPGSGLGLAIATDLLSALGGRVELTAPSDGGLRVVLRLPAGSEGQ